MASNALQEELKDSKAQENIIKSEMLAKSAESNLRTLISEKYNEENIFNQILLIKNFQEGELELFDDFVCKKFLKKKKTSFPNRKKTDSGELEAIFTCFLKIAGVENLVLNLLATKSIPEKLRLNLQKPVPKLSHDRFFSHNAPFSSYKMFELASSCLKDDFEDTNTNILAYLICINKETLYKGPYEAFYIIDYIFKDEDHCKTPFNLGDKNEFSSNSKTIQSFLDPKNKEILKAEEIILNWSKHCQYTFIGVLFSFNFRNFFEVEVLYSSDFQTIVRIIINKKSHRLFLAKFDFILKNLWMIDSNDLGNAFEALSISPEVSSSKQNTLANLTRQILEMSFSPEHSKSTDILLARLHNENIFSQEQIKDFIINTGYCSSCFFAVCKKIDLDYIKCFNLWLEKLKKYTYSSSKLDLMSKKQDMLCGGKNDCFDSCLKDVDLVNISRSNIFRIYTLQGFKKVVRIFKEMNVDLPIEKILKIDQNASKNLKGSIRYQSSPKKEHIDRIVFLLLQKDGIKIPYKILKKSIHYEYISSSILIMFRSGSFKLFQYGYKKLLKESLKITQKRNMVILDKSLRLKEIENLKRDLQDMIFMELKNQQYSKFYQKILGFLLRKKFLKSLFFISPSPYGLAMISKFKSKTDFNDTANDKLLLEPAEIPDRSTRLPAGLYFFKSNLKIENVYKKFIFYCDIVVFKGYMNDMTILRIGDELEINIVNGEIIVCSTSKKRDSNDPFLMLRKMISLFEESPQADKMQNRDSRLPIDRNEIYGNQNCSISTLSDFGGFNGKIDFNKKIDALSFKQHEAVSINISLTYKNDIISIIINDCAEERFSAAKISFLEVNEKFYGAIKNIFYAESNKTHKNIGNYSQYRELSKDLSETHITADITANRQLFTKFLEPIGKILRYENKRGFFMDSYEIFYLSSEKDYIKRTNIVKIQ